MKLGIVDVVKNNINDSFKYDFVLQENWSHYFVGPDFPKGTSVAFHKNRNSEIQDYLFFNELETAKMYFLG